MGVRNRGGRGLSYRPARLYIGWRNSFIGIDSGAPYMFKNTSSEDLHESWKKRRQKVHHPPAQNWFCRGGRMEKRGAETTLKEYMYREQTKWDIES
jgi:hypothetical protein